MQYPGSVQAGAGMGNGVDEDAKKRLIQQLAKRAGALPLFGGRGRSANDLPSVGAPAINFNPFLKMLADRPSENFGLQNNPNIQNGPPPIQGGGAPGDPNSPGFSGGASQAPAGQGGQDNSGGFGHYNDTRGGLGQVGASPVVNPQAPPQTGGFSAFNGLAGGGNAHYGGLQMGAGEQLDPATQLLMMHLYGYNQGR